MAAGGVARRGVIRRRVSEQVVEPGPNGAQGLLGLLFDSDFVEDVVDHFPQRLGLVGFEEQGALGATLDGCAWMQPFDRRCFAVR